MISGFVIPFSLTKGAAPYAKFFISRFFRLYPAYWFSIVLACCVMLLIGEPLPSWRVVTANITMLQMAFSSPNLIGVYWTLFIELIFYASCVALFSLGILDKPRKMIGVFFLLCTISIAVSAARYAFHVKLPVAIPLALALMYFGCVWRSAVIDKNARASIFIRPMLACLVLVTIVSSYLSYSWDTNITGSWLSSAIAYVISSFAFVVFTTRFQIKFAPAVFLGVSSYSLYLVHHPVINLFQFLSRSAFSGIIWPMMLAAITTAVCFSFLIYRFIEMPSVRAGKRCQPRRRC